MVSIIVPTYNEEAFLPRLLASIDAQDGPERELIVADNRSRDRTRAIARAAGARVVRGGTPAVGRNSGAAAAQGEYLLFLDADAVLPEGFLPRIVRRFDEEFVDICVPWIRPIDSTKAVFRTIFQFTNTFNKLMESLQPQGLGVCILVTRRLHERIGGFSEAKRSSEDFDYINRASLVGRFRVFSNVFVYHSVRRYLAEGVGPLVQKQFESGVLQVLTGRAREMEDYQFGIFSQRMLEERNGLHPSPDSREVRRLLSSFTEQGRRLQQEIKHLQGEEAGPAPRDGASRRARRRRPQ